MTKRTIKTTCAMIPTTLLFAACGGPQDIAEVDSEVSRSRNVTNMVIGIRDGASCWEPPHGSNWSLVEHTHEALNIFCVYEWRGAGEVPDADQVELEGHNERVSRNRPIVRPLSSTTVQPDARVPSTLPELLRPVLFSAYRDRIGIPNVSPSASSSPTVEVALVDTTPEGAPSPRSVHAPTLQALIEDVACSDPAACAVRVTKYVALPRIKNFAIDRRNGGHYGTPWDLAAAIVDAVDSSPAGSSLIVNLSVGWEHNQLAPNLPPNHVAEQLNPASSGVDVSVLAVHRAILYARCSGALIMAAAGNDPLVRRATGLMYPGGFTTLRAPTSSECNQLFTIFGAPMQAGTPLLVAVGGVDHRDLPITNSIPEAIPTLVAPAADVTPRSSGAVLTGTSVASASATAVAALAWSAWRVASANDIHAVLETTAVPLSLSATLGEQAVGDTASRISACTAAQYACSLASTSCRRFTCRPPPPAGSDGRPNKQIVRAALTNLPGPFVQLGSFFEGGSKNEGRFCGVVRKLNAPWIWSCPLDEKAAVHNLPVGPQPLDPICPACTVENQISDVIIHMSVVPELPNEQVENPMLYLEGINGSESIPLPVPIPQGFSGKVSLGPTSVQGPLLKAILSYDYIENHETFSASEPLMLMQ